MLINLPEVPTTRKGQTWNWVQTGSGLQCLQSLCPLSLGPFSGSPSSFYPVMLASITALLFPVTASLNNSSVYPLSVLRFSQWFLTWVPWMKLHASFVWICTHANSRGRLLCRSSRVEDTLIPLELCCTKTSTRPAQCETQVPYNFDYV